MSALPILGLLYCGAGGGAQANLRGRHDALTVYVRAAVTLSRSARAAGHDFTLITDDAEAISGRLAAEGLAGTLEVEEHAFALDVPPGIAFEAAHHKLELIRQIGEGRWGAQAALCDLDAVLLRRLELPTDALYAYDITAQMWAREPSAMRAGLADLLGHPAERARWYGGEFLAGPAEQFARLSARIDALWPTYRADPSRFCHAGDEMLLSGALATRSDDGLRVGEAGSARLVSRWWSRRTTNPIPGLAEALESAVVHLPSDKDWLAGQAARPFEAERFAAELRRRAAARLPSERLRAATERLLGRPATHVPRLA